MVAKDLTPAQIKAYRIADNQTASLATWDYELLPIELAELKGMDFDLGLLGFDQDELAKLLDPGIKDGLTDPDEVPEPPDEAITKPGDLWILGDHRLLCGDSGKPEHVDRLLAGAAIQLVNTDPPYNVKVEPRSNNAIAAGNSSFATYGTISQLDLLGTRRSETSRKDAGEGPAAGQRLCLGGRVRPDAHRVVRQHGPGAGARPRVLHLGWICKLRQLPAGAEGPEAVLLPGDHLGQGASGVDPQGFHGRHEWCFYGWKEGAGHKFFGPNNATDLWHVKKINPNRAWSTSPRSRSSWPCGPCSTRRGQARTCWTCLAAAAAR